MNTRFTAASPQEDSFIHLVGDLRTDIKTLVRKEMELARAEMGEKVKDAARNAALGGAGAVLGLIAFVMLLLGLGAILSRAFQSAGLSPATAYALAYGGLGLVLGGVSFLLIHKAMNALSKFSLSPEKALETVRGPEPTAPEVRRERREPAPSSEDLREEVIFTRARMDSEMQELKDRLKPGYVVRSSVAGIKHHPLRALIAGASAGLGGYLMWRHSHGASARRRSAARKWWQIKHA